MRVAIVSDCATKPYVHYLRRIRPNWEVKGLMIDEAERIIAAGQEKGLVAWFKKADLYIGFRKRSMPDALGLHPRAARVIIDGFHSLGLHPDCFHTQRPRPSPLIQGQTHSRIVAAAFCLGLDEDATAGLFNRDIYRLLAYAEAYEQERVAFLGRQLAVGLDLAERFDDWHRRGAFVHMPVHPAGYVLWDMLVTALETHGLLPAGDPSIRAQRESAEDFLATSIVWPVYPELGAPLGIEGSLRWKFADIDGGGRIDLRGFIRASFAIYSRPESQLDPEDLPRYARAIEAIRAYRGAGPQEGGGR